MESLPPFRNLLRLFRSSILDDGEAFKPADLTRKVGRNFRFAYSGFGETWAGVLQGDSGPSKVRILKLFSSIERHLSSYQVSIMIIQHRGENSEIRNEMKKVNDILVFFAG
jgi:hypothetical protein